MDDLPLPLALHVRLDRARAQPHARQIHRQDLVEVREALVLELHVVEDRRVVQQDVDPSEVLVGRRGKALGVLLFRDVGPECQSLTSEARDLLRHFPGLFLADVGDDDLGPFPRESESVRPSDALTRAGDDGHLVFQAAHRTGSIFSSKDAVPVSGMYGCRQISTGNDTMMSEYRRCSSRRASSGRSWSGNLSR